MPGTAPQTSIAARDAGMPGMLTGSDHVIEPCTNEEASASLPFGVMIKNGTAGANLLGKLLTATSEKFAGIVVHNHAYNRDTEVNATGMMPKSTFGILRRGQIHVLLEENVAVGDAVRVRCVVSGGEQAGAFRTTADSTDCVDISLYAQWRTAGSLGGTAVLEIDMSGAGLGDPD